MRRCRVHFSPRYVSWHSVCFESDFWKKLRLPSRQRQPLFATDAIVAPESDSAREILELL